jgi:hypothetical protein
MLAEACGDDSQVPNRVQTIGSGSHFGMFGVEDGERGGSTSTITRYLIGVI